MKRWDTMRHVLAEVMYLLGLISLAWTFGHMLANLLTHGTPVRITTEAHSDRTEYARGFQDGTECIILENLVVQIDHQGPKTMGELQDICLQRFFPEEATP